MTRKLTFTVVENLTDEKRHWHKFEDFKKDYLNPYTRMVDLRKKYEIPSRVCKDFVDKIHETTGIKSKPTRYRMKSDMSYIYELKDKWGIRKLFGNGRESVYYGYYSDLETAKMVRDKLYYSDWDEEVAEELIRKYSIGRTRTVYTDVMPFYEDFKELYLNQPLTYYQICEKLGISERSYAKLRTLLRKEIPNAKKFRTVRPQKGNMRYIYKNKQGYQIAKRIGDKTKYFGQFRRLEDAVNRRNKLERNNWVL